jgi:hypothetical protein
LVSLARTTRPWSGKFDEKSELATFRRKIHFPERGARQVRKIGREEHRKKETPTGVNRRAL